jgi:hypothetical protein
MKLIKKLLLLSFLIYFIGFSLANPILISINLPFSELTIDLDITLFCVIVLFLGSIIGYALRKSNRRDYVLSEKKLRGEVDKLKTQNKIYESELKIQNQIKHHK